MEEWILFTKKLPEKAGSYLVTITDGVYEWNVKEMYFSQEDIERMEPFEPIQYGIYEIIAWRNMPEPYRGDLC